MPSDTLTADAAAALGVRAACDLFGAVVSHPFVATKSITHALVDAQAVAPAGWSAAFAASVADVVLRGASAFCHEDAKRAGAALLAQRRRSARQARDGHRWRRTARRARPGRTARVLDDVPDDEIAMFGVVVEENLREVRTLQRRPRRGRRTVVATYCGTQRLTPNNHGVEVYGGSDLTVVRGEFERLLAVDLPAPVRTAVDQARRYDRAADAHFDGFFASRRNYDVAQGLDRQGRPRSGVLEQSWRIGGASGAELGALQMLRDDPTLDVVHARCIEHYGDGVAPPAGATLYYADVDPRVGRLTKYTFVEPHADAR